MKRTFYRCLVLLACGLGFEEFRLPAVAASGDLDLTFGSGGKVMTAIGSRGDYCRSIAVQSDGRIVVAGYSWNGSKNDFAVVRYHPDGSLDATFGNGGKVTTSIGSRTDLGYTLALQGDGKIVVAGYTHNGSNYDFALVRYNKDGSLDTSFGVGGMVTTDGGTNSSEVAYSVAVQTDGKIVVAGNSLSGSNFDFALARYNPDGSLDTSFGSEGKVITDIGTTDTGYSLTVQPDGKIVVAGESSNGNDFDFALVRYNIDGSLDKSFGREGKVITDITKHHEHARSVAVQDDGKIVVIGHSIVVAGYPPNRANHELALIRYNSDGSLDTGFGSDGVVITALSDGNDQGYSVAVQKNGKIVVAGLSHQSIGDYQSHDSRFDFAVVRYNANGTLDTDFGGTGKVTTAIGVAADYGQSMAVQSDGKIVVAGYSWNGSDYDFALARYEGISIEPVATTDTAIKITRNSAFLLGTVNPNASETAVFFEVAKVGDPYEPSGKLTSLESRLYGNNSQTVSASKMWLLPHTTYKFRVSASSRAGTSVGEDVIFTTANSKPVAKDKNLHPGPVGSTQAIFSAVTDASDADGDPLTVRVLSYTGTGSVEVVGRAVTYTGGPLNGKETVTVEVSDGFGGTDQAVITLSNAAPVAGEEVVGSPYGRVAGIAVLADDSDADGDALSVVSFTQPSHGEVTRAESDPNLLVYVPQRGFSGVDTFTYTMSDGRSAPVTGTVEITVGPRLNPSSSVAQVKGDTVPGAGEEGSNIPTGATWRSFGEPAINDAGQVAVVATWKSPEGSGSGILLDEQLVVKAGDPVPGLASTTFKSFKAPVLNGAGRVAFLATITGPGVRKNNDTVLATDAFSGELELVARGGDVAAETGEARFGKFYSVSLQGDDSDNAGLLFTASLLKGSGSPKVNPTSDLGAWLRTSSLGAAPRKVVREGDPGFAGGEKIKSFQLLQALRSSPGQGRGQYKADEISFTVTFTSNRQALVRFLAGALEEEVVTGELLGEALPEAKWKSFGLPATDGTGMVNAVRATLQNGLGGVTKANATGIFVSVGTSGRYAPVARVGDEPFGVAGAVFSAFSDPMVSGWTPGVAYLGSIRGQGVRANNNTGIWWQTLSRSTLVARAGMQATETPEGARWKSFSSLALPDGERGPLFVATLAKGAGSVNATNDTGLWAMDSVGEVRLLARECDPVGEKTLKNFSALQAVSGSAGVRRSFNDGGQVVYRAYFTDGSQGVVKVQVP